MRFKINTNCKEIRLIFHDILLSTVEDYCGLYETVWLLPEGSIRIDAAKASKKFDLKFVIRINCYLFNKGYFNIYEYRHGEYIINNSIEILEHENNYAPYDLIKGPGFALGATKKAEELAWRLNKRYGILGLEPAPKLS